MTTAIVHLTHIGVSAGVLLCGSPRVADGDYAHASMAPLASEAFRARCCPECLKVWAMDAYEDGDEMPAWVREVRSPAPVAAPVPAEFSAALKSSNQSLVDAVYRLTAELVVAKETHAAHVAKIQALTEALQRIERDSKDRDAFASDSVLLEYIGKVARAALSLPSA